jgi:hypothetical protein
MMVMILSDVLRRREIGGWAKASWFIFMIVQPFLGALVYIISQHDHMAERNLERAQTEQRQFDARVKAAAGTDCASGEIEKAEQLLARGTITQAEFGALKTKALAGH